MACVVFAGCHASMPVRVGELAPASPLIVRLTATGMDSLAAGLGPDVNWIRGLVVSASTASLQVAVAETRTTARVSRRWNDEVVVLPGRFIAGTERVVLSRWRTALAVAGGLSLAAVARAGWGGTGKSEGVVPAGSTGGR